MKLSLSRSISQSKTEQWYFALSWGLLFSPLLFLVTLLGSNPFEAVTIILLFHNPQTSFEVYLGALVSTLLQSAAVTAAIYLCLKKLSLARAGAVMVRLPVFFTLCAVVPSIIASAIIFLMAAADGGDGFAFVPIYVFFFISHAVVSILPIVLCSLLLYLVLVGKKKAALLIGGITLLLLGWHVFTRAFVWGCPTTDAMCVARRAVSSQKPEICARAAYPLRCYQVVSALKNDSRFCQKFPRTHQLECLNITADLKAYREMDPRACEAIICSDDEKNSEAFLCRNKKQRCFARTYALLALATGDGAYCVHASSYKNVDDLPDYPDRSYIDIDRCYVFSALKNNNKLLCEKLTEESDKERCRRDVKQCALADAFFKDPVEPWIPYSLFCDSRETDR